MMLKQPQSAAGLNLDVNRENVSFWRQKKEIRNFDDHLAEYFLTKLFTHIPKSDCNVRMIGGLVDNDAVAHALQGNTVANRPSLIVWGGGIRSAASLSPESKSSVKFLAVRGPLTLAALELDSSTPIGDPGLLLPALYTPTKHGLCSGKTLCIPDLLDARTDEDLLKSSGAEMVLHPLTGGSSSELEFFIDNIASASFVLSGCLHAAIVAAAYGVPFAFWGEISADESFKWRDFSGSINIPCSFLPDVAQGMEFYAKSIRPSLRCPSLLQLLASAPFFIQPTALIHILRHELTASGEQNLLPALAEAERIFSEHSALYNDIADGSNFLFETLSNELGCSTYDSVDNGEESEALLHNLETERKRFNRLAIEADDLITQISKEVRAPIRLLRRQLNIKMLQMLAKLSILPARMRSRFIRSAEKRDARRFAKKWFHLRAAMNIMLPAVNGSFDASKMKASVNRVLVSDQCVPQPDNSAGERATYGILEDLCALGFEVTFIPFDMIANEPYTSRLKKLGVEVITREDGFVSACEYIEAYGAQFGLFYLIRMHVAEAIMPAARIASPTARVIFHAPDLHFLRARRRAEIAKSARHLAVAEDTFNREISVMKDADHIVLVSPAEVPFLQEEISGASVSIFPALYAPVNKSPKPFSVRNNIFFLGGFGHSPNNDAVTWFVKDIWPIVSKALPGVEFHIVGSGASEKIIELGKVQHVQYVGHVEDLDSLLQKYRLGVAPLRYGAGIKGKVGMLMGGGTPCICTPIAAEGMGIENGVHTLIADSAQDFADAVIKAYLDENLWSKFSQNGQLLVDEHFGNKANRESFIRTLGLAKALPWHVIRHYYEQSTPRPLPAITDGSRVDVSIVIPVCNGPSALRKCLASIANSDTGATVYEVILAYDPNEHNFEALLAEFSGLRVVQVKDAATYLSLCNAAAKVARGRHILLANDSDVTFIDWMPPLYQLLESEQEIAIAGSKLLSPDGTIAMVGGVLFNDATCALPGHGEDRSSLLGGIRREVDYVCPPMLIKGSFWKEAGGFDAAFTSPLAGMLDIALKARSKGLRVLCEPRSETLRLLPFEASTYATIPDGDKARFTEKFAEALQAGCSAPCVDLWCAAASAERTPMSKTAAKRAAGKLDVLYFTPFPSHPNNHGNQATIQAFAKRMQAFGHRVHFVLLESTIYNRENIEEMRQAWDTLDILPNSVALWADKDEIPFDGWYESGLGERIKALCAYYDIDVVFCSYVFQSKLLEYVPAHMLKVIDTHDKMGERYDMLRKNGQPLEFFSCSCAEEGAYLRRADIVVARRAEEAEYFNEVTGRNSAVVIPHIEEPRFMERKFHKLNEVGLVASANRINLVSVLAFLQAFDATLAGRHSPVTIHVAGQVKSMVQQLSEKEIAYFSRPWVNMRGFVENIEDFYNEMDLVLNPVMLGTGINVKTVQAMAYGMPLLTTTCGIKGIETYEPLHCHVSLEDLSSSVLKLATMPEDLQRLAEISRQKYTAFYEEGINTMRSVLTLKGEH